METSYAVQGACANETGTKGRSLTCSYLHVRTMAEDSTVTRQLFWTEGPDPLTDAVLGQVHFDVTFGQCVISDVILD